VGCEQLPGGRSGASDREQDVVLNRSRVSMERGASASRGTVSRAPSGPRRAGVARKGRPAAWSFSTFARRSDRRRDTPGGRGNEFGPAGARRNRPRRGKAVGRSASFGLLWACIRSRSGPGRPPPPRRRAARPDLTSPRRKRPISSPDLVDLGQTLRPVIRPWPTHSLVDQGEGAGPTPGGIKSPPAEKHGFRTAHPAGAPARSRTCNQACERLGKEGPGGRGEAWRSPAVGAAVRGVTSAGGGGGVRRRLALV